MNPQAWRLRTRLVAGAVSGLALYLAFPPVDQGWVAVFAPIPMLLAVRGATARHGGAVGAAFGAAFLGPLMSWLSVFGWIAVIVLTLAYMVYTAAFGFAAARLGERAGAIGRLAGVPLLWTGLEMMRARWPLGGLTWGSLGASQHDGGTMLPIARLAGTFALGLVIMVVAAMLAEILAGSRWRERLAGGALGLVLLPGLLPLGLDGQSGTYEIAGIQGNVDEGTFTGLGGNQRSTEDASIVEDHLEVTARLRGRPAPDLIVWPENGFDRDPRLNESLFAPVRDLISEIGSPTILPAILDADQGFTNTNLLLDPSGRIIDRYDKTHLVPFGEYVPWGFARAIVPALDAEIPRNGVPGRAHNTFDVSGARLGTLICFESTYPELARSMVRQGAEIIIVTTNNSSYGRSPASDQHLALTTMRAVELGRPIVQVAISGVSAVIQADGTVTERTGLYEQALIEAEVPLAAGQTPYARYGSWIEIVMGLGAAVAMARATMRMRVA